MIDKAISPLCTSTALYVGTWYEDNLKCPQYLIIVTSKIGRDATKS